MDHLLGLPAHPFLVHLPVVLIPLVAAAGIALGLSERLRDRYGPAVLVVAFGTLVATFLAANAGETLKAQLPASSLIDSHARAGGLLRPLTLLLFVVITAIVVRGRRAAKRPTRRWVGVLLAVLVIIAGGAATVGDVIAGHTGAKAVWHGK